jgi:hypothetical protein
MRTNQPPRPAVGRDDDDASNALQSFCQHTPVRRHVERYARQPDAVEIAFQHRRHAVPPHWINQHDGFGCSKLIVVFPNRSDVACGVLVIESFLPAHHRIEPFCVQIHIRYFVPPDRQSLQYRRMSGGGEAFRNRMAIDHQDTHDRLPQRTPPGQVWSMAH